MTKPNMVLLISLLGAGLLVSSGCDREDVTVTDDEVDPRPPVAANPPAPVENTPAPAQVNAVGHRAVDSIADARCDREERCGNVGADKEYASREACQSSIRQDWAGELTAYECPGGINQEELDECMQEIRNDDCGNPFDTLGRVVACRSGAICESTTM